MTSPDDPITLQASVEVFADGLAVESMGWIVEI